MRGERGVGQPELLLGLDRAGHAGDLAAGLSQQLEHADQHAVVAQQVLIRDGLVQRHQLVAGGGQAHHPVPVHLPGGVDVPAGQHERELRDQPLLRRARTGGPVVRRCGDLLTGGGGADRFDYDSPFDTYPAMADVITDFSRAQGDKIDLSTLDANLEMSGNQAFQFIGAAPFTAAGQLRAVTSGGGTAIELNISDAPVGADLVIVLSSTVPMQATDFVL